MIYYILFGGMMLIGMLISWRLQSKFKQYSQVPTSNGMSGAEIANKMLHDNGINDVQVVSVQGFLSDHYNPANKTVNLSPEVYAGRSVAAAAVAAHECGHAVQHAKAYTWLQMRSKLVPITQIGSRFGQWVIIAGFAMIGFTGNPLVLWLGIALFALTTLFAFITLPVEFDASGRALAWLESAGITTPQEHDQAKDALKWAAMTYVVAALSSLATLLYYISIARRR